MQRDPVTKKKKRETHQSDKEVASSPSSADIFGFHLLPPHWCPSSPQHLLYSESSLRTEKRQLKKKQGILTSVDNSHRNASGQKLASSPAPHGPPHGPHFTFIGYQGTLSCSQFFICCEFSDEAAQTQSPQAGKVFLTLLKKGEHAGQKTKLNLKVRHKGEFALLMRVTNPSETWLHNVLKGTPHARNVQET